MNAKSEFDLVEVASVETVEEVAAIEMSLSDLDIVAGGATISSFY
jgi:hypothetical protein